MNCMGKFLNLMIFYIFINSFPVSSNNDTDCVPGETSYINCDPDFSGTMRAECDSEKRWKVVWETCVSLRMGKLLQDLSSEPKPPDSGSYMKPQIETVDIGTDTYRTGDGCIHLNSVNISCVAHVIKATQTTAGNIATIVNILNIFLRKSSGNVAENKMKYYGEIANHVLNKSAVPTWTLIPNSIGSSSALLQYMNEFASTVSDALINVTEDFVHMTGFKVAQQTANRNFSFSLPLNGTELTGSVFMEQEEFRKLPKNSSAVAIAYSTIGEILSNQLNISLNGFVISMALNANGSKLSLTFQKKIKSTANTKCVGWDTEEKNWMSEPCSMDNESYDHTTCRCYHSKRFMSFSILMSPETMEVEALYYISFVGIGISMCSLLICLIIEGLLWHHVTKTEVSYMRHLSIVNIAVSLLIADIWFIVGAMLFGKDALESKACIAATFFIHLFYLSLFFWMLVMALLISYRVLMVYHNMRKSSLICLAFAIGYGCPLIISAITLAATVTQPNKPYVRDDGCWLNWNESKALLAFFIPALLIIALNFIIVLTVIFVLLRPMVGENPRTNERNIIVQIIRCIAILTPLLGLTWGFGIATIIEHSSLAFHYIFTVLNAFQGFFILVFGTLMDKQVREALTTEFASPKWISFLAKNTSNSPASG